MSTDTDDYGHGRRRSDRAGAEPAVDEGVRPDANPAHVDDASTPLLPEQIRTRSDGPAPASAPSHTGRGDAGDADDGTPEGEDESDASEADEIDDPASTPIPPPVSPATRSRSRGRRRVDGGVREVAIAQRRRRSDGLVDREPAPGRTPGRRGWIAATIVFMLLFGGAAALDWYLWNTSDEWEERAGVLTDVNYDLGARLSSEQQTTLQLTSEIDLLTQQLATSNQKVTDLSSEKASAVDESAVYQQEIDALETSVSSAAGVANALHRCVDGQQELVTYLRDAENYDPEELAAFSDSVRELCAEAEGANDRLQEALNE
ncbi:hypothetical protein [Demequina aestuarii]|uniref:hypothetical protein n=1 Tax=Demequina aestuarii TaxID=327095 RepID=UPI0007809F25|nr:hypothetical protein [Demequina aestuarii]